MADSNRLSLSTIPRKGWFAIPITLLLTTAGVILLSHYIQHNEVLVPPLPPEPESAAEPILPTIIPQNKPAKVQSPVRWLLYAALALCSVGLLIILQATIPLLSTGLFTLIIVVTVCYGLYRTAYQVPRLIVRVRNVLPQLLRQSDRVAFIMVGIALYCAVGSALILKESVSEAPLFGSALLLFVISFGALLLIPSSKSKSVLVTHWNHQLDLPVRLTRPFHWRRFLGATAATLGGIFLLFLLAEINFNMLGWSVLNHVHHIVQLAFLVVGVILLVVGMGGRVRLPVMTRRESILLTGVVLFALVLRCVALDTVIPRYVDEINFMDAIPRLWAKPYTPILIPFSGITAFTWLYPMVQSGISNIIGSSLISLRLISVILGTLGVAALYFLVRTLFHDKWLALASALILATLPAHLHFSRLGLNNIADPLVGTLALAFLMRGLQSHQRSDYVIAGAALGLTQYFYEGGRLLFPPLFVAAFVISWLLSGHRRGDLVHAACALLVAVVIAAPVYYTLLGVGNFLAPRLQNEELSNNPWSPLFDSLPSAITVLRERLLYPLLMYTSISDLSWFYGGTQAIVMLPLAPIFLMGMAYALRKLRSPAIIVLFLWLVMTALGNSLLRDSLWVPRYVVAFPAVAVFVAMGLYILLALLWPASKPRRWLYVALASASIVLAAAQTIFYFRDQAPQFNAQFRQEDWIDAFFRMVNLPPATHVHFIMDSPMWDVNVTAFLGYNRLNLVVDALTPDQVTTAYLQKITADRSTQQVFFMNPQKKGVLARLQRYFTLDAPQFSSGITLMQYQLALYKALALSDGQRRSAYNDGTGFVRQPVG